MIISIFLPMTVAGKEAKVTFDYESQDQDELTLKLGDIVHVLGEEEPGWWRGQVGGKTGVFPSNFVEIITDNNVAKPKDTPLDTARKLSGLLPNGLEYMYTVVHVCAVLKLTNRKWFSVVCTRCCRL